MLVSFAPDLKMLNEVLYTFAFFAANEPPTAAATIARTVTKASATLRIRVVGRNLHLRQTCGCDGF